MRVHVVDPSAFTAPYDHALCRALGQAGAAVELYACRPTHGTAPSPEGYVRHEAFYRASGLVRGSRPRRLVKLAEHVPDMLRYRRAARAADVVHFQWVTVPYVDGCLLPPNRSATGARRPLVLTAHDILPREPLPGQRMAQRRLFDRFDAIVVHSERGRERLTHDLGVPAARIHVIRHGTLTHLTEQVAAPVPFQTDKQVVLLLGLLRPYKGIDVLLEAWRGIENAELWIAGMPRMDISPLRAAASPNVRIVPHFLTDSELAAYFRRADLVVLPYREIDQSGALFAALAFGKPLLLSDVGGFGEVAASGAARTVPPGDAKALHDALIDLLSDRAALAAMSERARAAARGPYAWEPIARRTLALYESLLGENPAG
jgi:glycosyltransferase involved in cell wall biosynthesis